MRWPIAAHSKAGAVGFTLQGGGRATSPSTTCDSSSATRREPFHPGGKARTRVCPDPGPGQGPLLCRTQRYISQALPTRCGTRVAWRYTAQAVPLRRQVTAAGVARPLIGPRPPPLQDSRYTPLPWIPPNGGGSMPQQVMRTNEPSVRGITGAQCRNALATPNPVRTGTRFKI